METVRFPAGNPSATHVFCYAYYIDVPPAQGSITIRKELTPGSTASQAFTYASNATFNPSGTFDLRVTDGLPAQTTFIRAVSSAFGGPYTFQEDLSDLGPQGWRLTSLTCTGSQDFTIDLETATVSIDLGADDAVTCTYVDDPPRDPGLTVRKTTVGGVGTFPITVTRIADAAGTPTSTPTFDLTATTTEPDTPVTATGLPDTVPAGTYQMTEQLPASPAGTWSVDQASCDGGPPTTERGTTITELLPVNGSADCTFVNRFTPLGTLTLNLVTRGPAPAAVGTGSFSVTTVDDPDFDRAQTATTIAPDLPAPATGDPLDHLAFGTYAVVSTPPDTTGAGSWRFVSFSCAGSQPVGALPDGTIQVPLSVADPTADCTVVYDLDPPTTVQLVKVVAGPESARTGAAVVSIDCADGSTGTVTVPAGESGRFELAEPLGFVEATTCTVQETDTGVAPGAQVSTRFVLTVNGQPSDGLGADGAFAVDRIEAGYEVTVPDTYALPSPSPTPTGPTPSPTGPTPSPTGPTPSPTGPTPSPTGPTPSPTGPTPSPTGPTPSPTGPTPSPTGPTPSPTGSPAPSVPGSPTEPPVASNTSIGPGSLAQTGQPLGPLVVAAGLIGIGVLLVVSARTRGRRAD